MLESYRRAVMLKRLTRGRGNGRKLLTLLFTHVLGQTSPVKTEDVATYKVNNVDDIINKT